jgi:hypothetical protein
MPNKIKWTICKLNFKNSTICTFLFHLKFTRNDVYRFPTLLHKLQGVISRKHFVDPNYIASFSSKSPDQKAHNLWRFSDTCEWEFKSYVPFAWALLSMGNELVLFFPYAGASNKGWKPFEFEIQPPHTVQHLFIHFKDK